MFEVSLSFLQQFPAQMVLQCCHTNMPAVVCHDRWAVQSNPLKQLQLRGHDDAITAFAMSPNGACLATGQKGGNSDVITWDTQSLAQQFR